MLFKTTIIHHLLTLMCLIVEGFLYKNVIESPNLNYKNPIVTIL